MNRFQRLVEFLRKSDFLGMQVFDSESLVGDCRDLVYDEDGIEVYVCYYYEYVEILGLSKDEFNQLVESKHGFDHIKDDL